ncbi:LCP family protein [Halalkalibacterium halodurans]|uniref:Polyisoprenyl-teichoic acid--peptidoglycan teichoic acid transferase TagU n=1 Tax=Halalkalibacterium halodurans (strain ATCC BAA-125 / DSM 18197 / FERM 7344 / JCM 9153 / C-125) TaxID=272558 RepID=TAGU_HALH5|nr:LCP family protein [Halalkalibacterium halodurans]Q9K6Q8.1 RecName: Full=Polyisoprenyl-teichoic acid--peptidoglycan teichoic acid transferase TagU [Halalkalibacterium halodurans C-125]MED4172955.1 LCP family protein [Halalkalibacterium halodurans]BAB07389.1 attenuator for lytABC and lytR expression [Halalkalibacterium halodurans C-125]
MKKALIAIGLILGTITVAIIGYGIYLYSSIQNTAGEMHEPLDRGDKSDKRDVAFDISAQDPFSILIAGVDSREDTHAGRSDTLIVLTVNPKEESIKMLSIPRDTRTEIVGRGTDDKINHAYAFGGAQMTIDTVENFLDIPIDHYVSINMDGFTQLVDALGGVSVENSFAFSQNGYQFEEGEIFLETGDEALAYARMRKQDSRGDFGRNDRQRQIVEAVIKQSAQFSSITKAGAILDAVGESVRTDLQLDGMWELQSNYRGAAKNIEQLEITGEGTRINNIYYLIIPQEEIARVQGELKSHLELS